MNFKRVLNKKVINSTFLRLTYSSLVTYNLNAIKIYNDYHLLVKMAIISA